MKKGFTLVEVLIAISLFALVAVLASNVLIDVVKIEKKSSIQNAIYEDARIIMQKLVKEIQAGTIDYEEYYNIKVAQSNIPDTDADKFYGINYGVYSSRFYDPGRSRRTGGQGNNPVDLGIECSRANGTDCEIYYTNSADINTGQNPYTGFNQTNANSVCDNNVGQCNSNVLDQLYLINSTGNKKTIIGRKKVSTDPDFVVGMVQMEGRDYDQNGVIDIFSCLPEFKCYGEIEVERSNLISRIKYPFFQNLDPTQRDAFLRTNNIRVPQRSDLDTVLEDVTTQFVPISPLRANIKDLKFVISPLEDPYKAYAEPNVQMHPTVTIVMTVELANRFKTDYPAFPELTIQTTVTSGVIGKIESYPPVQDVLGINGRARSWVDEVLQGLSVFKL